MKDINDFRTKAEQGDPDAQAKLGCCYYFGKGTPKDPKTAVYWWIKAAEQGHSKAQFNLGACYFIGEGTEKDEGKGAYWHTQAAEQGDIITQLMLGMYFYLKAIKSFQRNSEKITFWSEETGWISKKDIPEDLYMAEYWWTKAAEQGDDRAQCLIGAYYHIAEYGPRDIGKTVFWWIKAAEQGNPEAQYNLGVCYYKGEGIQEDKGRAIYWWSMAAMQGNEEAKTMLDEVSGNKESIFAKSPFYNYNMKLF
jgi:TPR repeat protein